MLVSGWLVLQSRFFRHYIWDLSGYNRYFLIALAGIATAGIGIAFIAAMYWIFGWELERLPNSMFGSPEFAEIWKSPAGYEAAQSASASVRLALFWSVPAGFVFGLLAHALAWVVPHKVAVERRTKYLAEVNGIQNFVAGTDKQTSLVMLTFSNRKVYIGWPRRLSDSNNPNPSKQYLYFVPFWSGFRKQKSLELKITTHYIEARRNFLVKRKFETTDNLPAEMSAWEIVLPVNEIIHAQPFDPEFYEEIQRANLASKRKPARKTPHKTPLKPRPK
ncbi:MAG: hypothetical protein OD918_11550 [Gammaproteobacteria bacterium]